MFNVARNPVTNRHAAAILAGKAQVKPDIRLSHTRHRNVAEAA
jgi:hypothetical protein